MGRMRYGVHHSLEEEANRLLRIGAVTHPIERGFVLSPAQEALRRRREILVESGTPDVTLRRGVPGRSVNPTKPHLNARDGIAQPVERIRSASVSSLVDFMDAQFG